MKKSEKYFKRDIFREFRVKKNINQYDFAERIGTDQCEISKIETGIRCPSVPQLMESAKIFGCDPHELLNLDFLKK